MMKKIMLRVMPIVLVALMIVSNCVCAKTAEEIVNMGNNGGIGNVNNLVGKIWGTVLTILQVCAVAAIVFAGVKYMFASPDGKADIKSGMLGLVIGAIMVFAASTLVKFIVDTAESAV